MVVVVSLLVRFAVKPTASHHRRPKEKLEDKKKDSFFFIKVLEGASSSGRELCIK